MQDLVISVLESLVNDDLICGHSLGTEADIVK